eukprot:CAMPEP_0198530882 /NCGR_PEP_ID=MMETSP1462-20131121/26613_1 /TAXON_ID=1333877 /ORGANISM="Brandtodinium nutriculum, Strain RCC3387" /LENGTH=289 /DNA_ID=CAMNT_0044260759 /DNA_START=160 /DNA_END=1027 /DNA_ORIENTATION=+
MDGFIARENGEIDWLDEANKAIPAGDDLGWTAFQHKYSVIIMGRKSFEKVRAMPLAAWPYHKPIVVLTRNAHFLQEEQKRKPLPDSPLQKVSQSLPCESLQQLMVRLEAEYGKTAGIYIDGGETIRAFLEEGLVQEMTVTLAPVLLGRGLPLFAGLSGGDRKVDLVLSKSWPCGFVQNTFRFASGERRMVLLCCQGECEHALNRAACGPVGSTWRTLRGGPVASSDAPSVACFFVYQHPRVRRWRGSGSGAASTGLACKPPGIPSAARVERFGTRRHGLSDGSVRDGKK